MKTQTPDQQVPSEIDYFLECVASLRADAWAAKTNSGRSDLGRIWSILSSKIEELEAVAHYYLKK